MKTILIILLSFICTVQAEKNRPNILFILSDDHSLPHLGCYGNENIEKFNITPHLNAFAKESMLFTKVYTTSPQCAPSRASIFAGRSPIGILTTRFAQPVRPDVTFFTDTLRQNGYWVGIDGRHHHLDGRMKEAPHMLEALKEAGLKNMDKRFDRFNISKTKAEYLSKVEENIGLALDQVPDAKPFFLYFGFNQPHRKFGKDHVGIAPDKLVLPADWPDLPEVRVDYARYLAEVRDLDTGFGMIEKVLNERGLKENTIVIFMGDNGEALLRGKGTLYSRGLNVPLLIRWPGKVKAGSQSQALVSGEDLAATILDSVGLKNNPGMTGISFLPALKGDSYKERTMCYGERGWHHGPLTRIDGLDLSRSITTKRYNFIYNAIPDRSFAPVGMTKENIAWDAIVKAHENNKLSELHQRLYFSRVRPTFELYDLNSDPLEANNLAGSQAVKEVETKLRQEMDKWMIRESDYLPLPSHVYSFMKKKK
ncbi:MAG: sulfatase [Lentisphaeraceae bacterium]|nr:sulfatase [Lentisphaeraceae bacterium]